MVWGSVISAVGSLAGGLLGDKSNRDSAAADRAAQFDMNERNERLQREFAQHGIRWRVEDAKAAGLHPLFALGGQGATYSPSTYIPSGSSSNMPAALASAGDSIGRAVDATRTATERNQAKLDALTLERGELENELLRSEIARNRANANPPAPSSSPFMFGTPDAYMSGVDPSGGGHPGLKFSPSPIQEKPMERTVPQSEQPWQEPGAVSDSGFVRTPTGLAPVPSKDAKERLEDMAIPEIMWSYRNLLMPNLGAGSPPPHSELPSGAIDWEWSYSGQEWRPKYLKKGVRLRSRQQVQP